MNIDPGVITLIQTTFLEHIKEAFATASHYAFNLLYLFAALELVVLGFAWMLQWDVGWDRIFFKIIKIGIIFFIIQNYTWLLNIILLSFSQLAGIATKNPLVPQYVFNPAKIWQYGYNVGVHLLQLATTTNLMGLTLTLFSIGMGILLIFGLLGIQMVSQMIGFYVVSFGALVLLPFGTLSLGKSMLDKAVQAVFQAGLRLMVLIIIIGIAVLVWDGFQLTDLATTTNFNINQPLGLFFTALLFLCLGFYLPRVISQAVGDFGGKILDGATSSIPTVREPATAASTTPSAAMQIATTIAPTAVPIRGYSYEWSSSIAAATTIPTVTVSPSTKGMGVNKETPTQASIVLSRSISENTIKKIKVAITQAVKEKAIEN
ncbi:MAG: type IV secretion system protein [Coxiellaceae bacterium]|jgi:P-type conjugative transfer protein TrbL|nr:type IV secretion system protein [Coxiellaceae bacterium]